MGKFNWINLIVWLAGFIVYRWLLKVSTPVGNTLPDFIFTVLLCVIVNLIAGTGRGKRA